MNNQQSIQGDYIGKWRENVPIVSTSVKVYILRIKTYIFIYLNTKDEEWKYNSDKNQFLL